jgi:hypothetical protein
VYILENDQIRSLLELRKELEDQIEEFKQGIVKLEAMLQKLDSVIGMSSFTTADRIIDTAVEDTTAETEVSEITSVDGVSSIVIRSKDRDLDLATIEVSGSNLKIIPADHAIYDIKRGAFARFFIERILGNFQQEDRHIVESGTMQWEEAFDFEVQADESILKELIIRNYGGEERLSEIQRTLRWALDKIYRAR